jgi:transcriptional regulator of acetoin/glycerol metabolism
VNHLSVVRDPEELTRLLEECDWNKAEVGRRLGISRTAVWKWMRRHGMPLQRPEED